jgi:hypothetical protein
MPGVTPEISTTPTGFNSQCATQADAVNGKDISVLLDPIGVPMVVWHHANADFEVFRPWKNGLIRFTTVPEFFRSKGDRRIAAFIKGEICGNSAWKITSFTFPN